MPSFLEASFDKPKEPFELGPLAKKIKASRQEKIKAGAQKIVNDIVKSSSPYGPVAFQAQTYMNTYQQAMMNQPNSHYYSQPQPEQFESTNAEIAETLAELSYEDISDIVDRAYQIKSMKANKLPPSMALRKG